MPRHRKIPRGEGSRAAVARADIVREARSWIGTPWKHQGCLKGRSCDCVGLVKGVALELGLPVGLVDAERYRGYSRLPNPGTMLEGLDAHLGRVRPEAAGPGDVLLFVIDGNPQHLAILSECGSIVHAYTQARGVVEQAIPPGWRRRVIRAYRYPGVE